MELRTRREAGELAPISEWYDALMIVTGKMVSAMIALPPRFTGDLGERQRLETMINELRTDVADWSEAEGTRLEEIARKSGRRRT
jgi:hypothetical protein